MNKKEIKKLLVEANTFRKKSENEKANNLIISVIKSLHKDKKYIEITKIFNEEIKKYDFIDTLDLSCFEVAYSFDKVGDSKKAGEIYETILLSEDSVSVMNNLALIKERDGEIKNAYKLFKKAKKIADKIDFEDKKIINSNFERLTEKIAEIEKKEKVFTEAVEKVKAENDFVIDKLNNFVTNIKKDQGFINWKIPIPRWKFAVMMQTDKEKADSLREQWLNKGYVMDAGIRDGEYNTIVYEVNPYLEKLIKKISNRKINKKWLGCLENINAEELDKINYFELKEKIKRVNKKYRKIIIRDFDELIFNYLAKNEKAIIILSGSLVEAFLLYYCEKKKLKMLVVNKRGKQIKIKLYDCNLGILLDYFKQNKSMSDLFIYLGNIARIYRNFVHAGKELREKDKLNHSTSNLCFISAMEIIKRILR